MFYYKKNVILSLKQVSITVRYDIKDVNDIDFEITVMSGYNGFQ